MRFPRSSGIILHPTSLPGEYGIGDLGRAACRFIDWLADADQKIWQVLPLGPTGYGDSPYQLFSAFAGNPLLIDVEALAAEGSLDPAALSAAPAFPDDEVDFGRVLAWKLPLLRKAARHYLANTSEDYDDFCLRNEAWLDDFALFMALKQEHGGAVWNRWTPELVRRDDRALDKARTRLRDEIGVHKFLQYAFFRQWFALKSYARERGIRIMGDLPIYVAHDSADVWANPELFLLDAKGSCTFVAGVPPDYFSATGQLWGNPIYRWDVLEKRGYGWWIERLRATLALVDMIRLDHFRGSEAYWQVPGGATTAINGKWV
jgi:4-alpha-glucanotransferase